VSLPYRIASYEQAFAITSQLDHPGIDDSELPDVATCIEVSSMPASTRRRITLLDLVILVAATALGFALLRVCITGLGAQTLSRRAGAGTAGYITTAETYASALLAPWSLAVLVLSLRGPRPSFQRLARGPGFIASAAATTGVALYLTLCLAQSAMGKLTLNPGSIWRITDAFALYASLMVAGSWLSLALGARWRMETSWVGWAGRILGIGWIGLFLLGLLRGFV